MLNHIVLFTSVFISMNKLRDISGYTVMFHILRLLQAGRPEGNAVNHERAKRDAVVYFDNCLCYLTCNG